MKLDLKDLKNVLHGYVDIIQKSDGSFEPVRFSEKQLKVSAENPDFLIRALSSAGMYLEFESDADAMVIAYGVEPGSAHDEYAFDTWVDGRLLHHYVNAISSCPQGTLRVDLPAGTHPVRCWLPHLAKTVIRSLTLENASFFKPIQRKKRLLCLGDSITQGYIAHFPSNAYPAALSRRMDASLLNQGIGGERFHPEMLDADMPWQPTHITIAYGTNDWAVKDKSSFIRDAEAYIGKARDLWKNVPIAIITPIWRADHAVRERPSMDFSFSEARASIQNIALKHDNIFVIAGENILPPLEELMEDGYVHPNDLGFTFYADALAEALSKDWF